MTREQAIEALHVALAGVDGEALKDAATSEWLPSFQICYQWGEWHVRQERLCKAGREWIRI